VGVGDHAGYLAKLGRERSDRLVREAGPEVWREEAGPHWWPDRPASAAERQVVATSRLIMERVRAGGHQAVLAGVGLANLAAWTGVEQLRVEGHDVELMAEIGLFGYAPRPGNPFISPAATSPRRRCSPTSWGCSGRSCPARQRTHSG
jgi:hypothetical protein